jgi:hypothetical protein
MANMIPNNDAIEYFNTAENPAHRQYLALRRFYLDGEAAESVAAEFGYAVSTVYTLARDFKAKLATGDTDPFFIDIKPGRKRLDDSVDVCSTIESLRKQNLSVPEIKSRLDAANINVSERSIYNILDGMGFARLPRRDTAERAVSVASSTNLTAPKSKRIDTKDDKFSTQIAGVLCFLPLIQSYGIDKVLVGAGYAWTRDMARLPSLLSFLALKLSFFERYSHDDAWCMDRGLGLFAGLNVLPKAAWFNSYSSSSTRTNNLTLLKDLDAIWQKAGLLSDTVNLDFTAIPYWGDEDPFENNWSGKRTKALASIQAVIAQDPENGIICYGDTTIRHDNQDAVALEFLDFYKASGADVKCLVFDSRFTTYQNLSILNQRDILFITIQRRGKNLNANIEALPKEAWQTYRILRSNGKTRLVQACENTVSLKNYDGEIRQIFVKNTGREKAAIIITNDMNSPIEKIVRKYARRWLVEKEISEHIHFFHLNSNSSGIVVKVDFDLTMTILAHNLYRLLAMQFDGYSHCEAKTIFEKFIRNAGDVSITTDVITVRLKRKRTLPLVLEAMNAYSDAKYSWLGGKKLLFEASSST